MMGWMLIALQSARFLVVGMLLLFVVLIPVILLVLLFWLLLGSGARGEERRESRAMLSEVRRSAGRIDKRIDSLEAILLPEARSEREERSS